MVFQRSSLGVAHAEGRGDVGRGGAKGTATLPAAACSHGCRRHRLHDQRCCLCLASAHHRRRSDRGRQRKRHGESHKGYTSASHAVPLIPILARGDVSCLQWLVSILSRPLHSVFPYAVLRGVHAARPVRTCNRPPQIRAHKAHQHTQGRRESAEEKGTKQKEHRSANKCKTRRYHKPEHMGVLGITAATRQRKGRSSGSRPERRWWETR